MRFCFKTPLLAFLLIWVTGFVSAQTLDLTKAKILNTVTDKGALLRTEEILIGEIQKRSGIKLPNIKKWPKTPEPLIVLTLEAQTQNLPETVRTKLAALPPTKPEGFQLLALPEINAVIIDGHDARGLLYGTGRLLRNLEMTSGSVQLRPALAMSTSPKYPIRGHQLGYRPKTNAYDAFTVERFDQYIRDLALFGANHIEILPPRTDDDFSSIHMKLPAEKMIVEQSRICKEYGLNVSMWYPNLGKSYDNADSVSKELKEREHVFSILPKLNTVFVPAGDPGDLEPDVLFSFLEKEAAILKKYHPEAKIWVSPQVFRPSQEWYDTFFKHVNNEYPWFGGVVFGPWVKLPVQKIRELVKPSIPIRHYPDITHNYSCQYPVPGWDLAYAMTLGRESINPRPLDEKAIHNALDEYGIGSVSYSEGTNDDVNKFIWSDQDWDPERPVAETLREYARLFIGPEFTEAFTQGLFALERNWRGELLTNEQVDRTLQQWQAMERKATNKQLGIARFQMGLIRAYFDAYTRQRLIYETDIERQAKETLSKALQRSSITALDQATAILERAWKQPILPELQQKCEALADSLFKSIGAQLTMQKHGAMSGRGNFIDLINMPLNDAPYLLDQFEQIRKLGSEQDRLDRIHQLLHRTDAGPGGFYDHFGSPESWYRVVPGLPWEKDPCSLQSPRVGFGVGLVGEEWVDEIKATGFKGQVTPRVWMKQAKTLYDVPLRIHYDNLDSQSDYKVKISYTGRFRSKMKMTTDDGTVIHDFIQTGETPVYEFSLPKSAIHNGQVTFTWHCGEGERGAQVTEIWLIKK